MTTDEKILLVEDDPAARKIATHAFGKSGVPKERIVEAKDGQEAMDYLFGDGGDLPRLVLLDLKMPKVDGLEVLKRIRSEERTRGVPVIILTNSDEEKDIVRGYDLGANSYLRKPIDFNKLVELLEQLGLV